jgi:6-pyruvoyltetrahydropterin/6-carboxytetrahydropterin synthase
MHRVSIEKQGLHFSAAHFIAFAGKCERLHGHNYAVSAAISGTLTGDGYVFDFVECKRLVKKLCDRLDHRFLLPRKSSCLTIAEAGGEVEIRFKDRRYVFPREDVLDMDLDSITAERLAEYLAGELAAEIAHHANITLIEVGVEESFGQTACFSLTVPGRVAAAGAAFNSQSKEL